MLSSKLPPFLLLVLALAVGLAFCPFDRNRIAGMRLEEAWRGDAVLRERTIAQCGSLQPSPGNSLGAELSDRLRPLLVGANSRKCEVSVQGSLAERFRLRVDGVYRVLIVAGEETVLERPYSFHFPTPLAFLPILTFPLAAILGVTQYTMGIALTLYLFAMAGGGLIQAVALFFKASGIVLTTDTTFLGLSLIGIWFALYRSRGYLKEPPTMTIETLPGFFSRLGSLLVGLWNPFAYSTVARLFFNTRDLAARYAGFLDGQILVALLSLYLLAFDFNNVKDSISTNVFIPRYLSFSALLFLALTYWRTPPRLPVLFWRLPNMAWTLGLLVIVQMAASFVRPLGEMPTLLRIGFCLLASELLRPKGIAWRAAGSWLRMTLPALFAPSLTIAACQVTGLLSLGVVLFDPSNHPMAIAFFTFVAGIALGFFTGAFSTVYFALEFLVRAGQEPTTRAALLDGILAGNLLSPFSLFNCISAKELGLGVQQLFLWRLRQLAYPLLIASAIYAVSANHSVRILQPVTFVFLCLAAVAFELKKSAWNIRRSLSLQDSVN